MDIKCEDMMEIAINAGSLVLENGGEIYRTEQTVTGIAKSLGAKTSSCFVTPTVIQFSYTDNNDHYHTAIRRITNRDTNLKKLSQINELYRRIINRKKISTPRQIEVLLNKIDKTSSYPNWLIYLMGALSSFAFVFLFNGSFIEALVAFFIGGFLRIFLTKIAQFNLGTFFVSLCSGFIISVLTELFFLFNIIPATETVLISVLMQVVPGIAIVNAIRDIIAGDLVAGTARLVEAFMIAAGLSIGSVFGLLIFTNFRPNTTEIINSSTNSGILYFILVFIYAFFASGSSAFYLKANIIDIFFGASIGGLGWLVYCLVGTSGVGAYFLGAFTVAILSELLAAKIKNPATVFLIPGLLPLVPGGGMFKTMRACANGLMNEALRLGFSTLCAAAAIALGIALATSFAKITGLITKNK